ncbi:GcrA family cell cycle regulator [Hoeflea prorocentri]|uniref:GcrA family cell cycle regulator n=1 Tax=Hoeflea prorocentri TaxID=1922333 RepID=A0A9X3UNL7_9HYPH|nr:GcrA family cell cycle regulator [Hoeflea prorocentri]MCY6382549.1 GcrA family cell cycle regulator [Hoeflea prorocentri]MDA5400349.1 GcrA family cell cycle regulator [Hoeflea prorocentri]
MSWTDERVERLKKLWADGLSASQIAAELGGVSRNAVIGKVHRLHLPGRAKSGGSSASRSKRVASGSRSSYGSSRSTVTRSIPRTSGATALKQEVIADAIAEIDTRPVEDVVVPIFRKLALTELTEKTCKWPVGDPLQEDFYFCGTDCDDNAPYCGYHSKLAFQPAADRKRSR